VGRESDRDFGEFAWQFGEMATKGPRECFRLTDSRRLRHRKRAAYHAQIV